MTYASIEVFRTRAEAEAYIEGLKFGNHFEGDIDPDGLIVFEEVNGEYTVNME